MVINSVGDLRFAHIYFEFSCGFDLVTWFVWLF